MKPYIYAVLTALTCSLLRAQETPLYKNPSAPVEERVKDLLPRMTLEEKIDMLGGLEDFYIRPNERLGIPKIKMADGPLGVRNYGDATAFPAGICRAATWNADLENRLGVAVGKEARSKGVHIMLAPGVNIYRAPMAGRNFEYFGEDPYLAGRMAAAYVKGVQSQGVVTTVKHFAANNQEYDRNGTSSDMDERTLQEIYLPAFKAAVVEGGSGSIMTAYNPVNGVHCSQNEHLLRDVLKGQWKFDGFVMSDWGATHDGIAAANGGLDLEMPSREYLNRDTLLPAIKVGKVKESTIDDKVRRMLRVIFRFGFFDRSQQDTLLPRYNPDSRLVALQAAREGIVLLKNNANLLPLDRSKIKSIAVIGPNANPAVTGGGGSSIIHPFRAVSVLDGMVQVATNNVKVYYDEGLQWNVDELFSASTFRSNGNPGLKGEYFSNMNLEGKPAFTRTDEKIDFNWSNAQIKDFQGTHYSVRWTGTIHAEKEGRYDFVVRGDDGFRLFVDNYSVINAWKDQPATTETAQWHFAANSDHEIRLEYYQNEGNAVISFGWGMYEPRLDQEVLRLASASDVAVVCVGFNPSTEGEGFDRTFELPVGQEQLINAVAGVNPNTIVVLNAGGNVLMTGWIDHVAGLIHSWYPGQEGGTAVAEVIFGDVNPSGKLPASFEKRWEDNACFNSYYGPDKHVNYSEGVFVGYRHFDKTGIEPMFPFGFGLSYTSFKYDNLKLSADRIGKKDGLKVAFDVTNTGTREGAEVAQLYIHDDKSSEPRPIKELKGFAKVSLKPGESKTIELAIDESALSFFSSKKSKWIAEPGVFEIMVGSSSKDIRLTKTFTLE
ncbi:MAG: glycoside hydrolase family 3 C-terminal domain-containing protein [Bacteroidota bacterium]